jgi:hypothetical protein
MRLFLWLMVIDAAAAQHCDADGVDCDESATTITTTLDITAIPGS